MFDSVYQKLLSIDQSVERGKRFEKLILQWLSNDPEYQSIIEKVWMWSEWPLKHSISQTDVGIDLVAQSRDGNYYAIQCKCYAPDTKINKEDIDTFVAASSCTFKDEDGNDLTFDKRWFVSTHANFSSNAQKMLDGQQNPVTLISHADFDASPIDWDELYNNGIVRKVPKSLRPHQIDAIRCANRAFLTETRGKWIMACGTGKTYATLRLVEHLFGNKKVNVDECDYDKIDYYLSKLKPLIYNKCKSSDKINLQNQEEYDINGLNAQRSTLNAQRSTLNAQRSTLNAQRSTLNAQQKAKR